MFFEFLIKDTIESETFISYLDILLDKNVNGYLTAKLYVKGDDFNFFHRYYIFKLTYPSLIYVLRLDELCNDTTKNSERCEKIAEK